MTLHNPRRERPIMIDGNPATHYATEVPRIRTPFLLTNDQRLSFVFRGGVRFCPDQNALPDRCYGRKFWVGEGTGWIGVVEEKSRWFSSAKRWELWAYACDEDFQPTFNTSRTRNFPFSAWAFQGVNSFLAYS